MQQILDMLAKGNYRGIALLIVLAYSGALQDMQKARERTLEHMGPDSHTAEFVEGVISISLNFMVLTALATTVIIIILQDAGIDVVPDRFKSK